MNRTLGTSYAIEKFVRVSRSLDARRRTTIFVGCALMALSLPPAVLLYANLRAGIEELLPKTAPSIKAIDTLHARLGDNMQLTIYVTGAPAEKLHRFADELARRAHLLKQGAPRLIDYHPKELQDFFGKRKILFANLKDVEEVEARVKERLAFERKKANPFSLGLDDEKPPSFDDIIDRFQAKASLLRTYPSGYYDGADGQSLAMVFYASSGMTGYEASIAFRDRIGALGQQVARDLNLSRFRLQYTGDIESVIQEQRSLQSDILTSTIIVLVLEALLFWGFYRWGPSVVALGFPLAVGTLSTFAIAYLAIGSLNASSAFLGSIIAGNGVNSGIILLSRYLEERRRGKTPDDAMPIALRGTIVSTLIASSAAAVSYASLMITDFRGYSHFGFMGGVGMILCWVVTYLLLPPVTIALDQRWPFLSAKLRSASVGRAFHVIGVFSVERPRLIAAACALITALAVAGLVKFAPDPIDHDTTHLRSSWASAPGGTLEIDAKVDTIMGRVLTPIVILTATEAQTRPLAAKFERAIKAPGKHLLGTVLTLQSLVAEDQERKIEILKRIRKRLRSDWVAKLDDKTRALVKEWLLSAELTPFTSRDLPEEVRRQFREKDGSEGRLVLLFPKHGTKTTDGRIVTRLAREARAVPLPPGAVAASSYLVFAEMFEDIQRDGMLATIAAFLAVTFLSAVLARSVQGTFAVTLSLIIGVVWTVGLAALTGMRFNFLNFIALPITFGIGVDYATNVYGRFRLEGVSRESLVRAVGNSGSAVAVCSATTIIGYSSLLLSRNGALFSFGALAVLGEVACLTAALFLMPAFLGKRLPPRTLRPPPMEHP
jgi:predicted RND superfamily exporter protein